MSRCICKRALSYTQNPNLECLNEDNLHHISLNTKMDLPGMFGNVKFVCTGGTDSRMRGFAEYIKQLIGERFPVGVELSNISAPANRYSMYKVGPVLCVSHGMGNPSMGILTNELIKLMHYAKCRDPVFFRIGTCGSIGHDGGTVIISDDCCDGCLRRFYSIPVLGKMLDRPAQLDKQLIIDLKNVVDKNDNFKVISGTTMCAEDFYEGQARMDGPFCKFSDEDKLQFFNRLCGQGIVNIEMESTSFAALTKQAGIKACVVCVALVNRLKGDSVRAYYLSLYLNRFFFETVFLDCRAEKCYGRMAEKTSNSRRQVHKEVLGRLLLYIIYFNAFLL
ncbi:unnamed protein product [Phyllotreta striolata]|uniref:Uridine phosphorylase n=1 Tax=Phyllotreta striolata TaxID=444603 RepID=A0A9P0DUQ8_PHYSR|nr:unnamed protein product [Phyllotreta striolata]